MPPFPHPRALLSKQKPTARPPFPPPPPSLPPTYPQKLKLEIVDPPRRRHAVFEGASVLGSIYANNDTYWFSKAQYAEEGAARLAGKVRSLVGSGH